MTAIFEFAHFSLTHPTLCLSMHQYYIHTGSSQFTFIFLLLLNNRLTLEDIF